MLKRGGRLICPCAGGIAIPPPPFLPTQVLHRSCKAGLGSVSPLWSKVKQSDAGVCWGTTRQERGLDVNPCAASGGSRSSLTPAQAANQDFCADFGLLACLQSSFGSRLLHQLFLEQGWMSWAQLIIHLMSDQIHIIPSAFPQMEGSDAAKRR